MCDVPQQQPTSGVSPGKASQTLGSGELMRILEQKDAKSKTAAASAEPNKENESDSQRSRAELMLVIQQRLAGCKLPGGAKTTTTNHSKPKTMPAPARSQPTAAAQRPKTGAASAPPSSSSSSQSSPRRRAADPPKLFVKPCRPQSARSALSAANPTVPSAYNYKDIYERKQQHRKKQLQEEERKAREVVARPMPNFSLAHRQLEQQYQAKRSDMPTCPNTPQTLRSSQEAAERRKQRVCVCVCVWSLVIGTDESALCPQHEEYLRQKYEVIAVKARSAEVLAQAPFKPTIVPREIETKPFRMAGHERLDELRAMKERRLEEQEAKRQLELAEQEQLERQQRKEIRKQTVFKARPNPFA